MPENRFTRNSTVIHFFIFTIITGTSPGLGRIWVGNFFIFGILSVVIKCIVFRCTVAFISFPALYSIGFVLPKEVFGMCARLIAFRAAGRFSRS
ncbi:hypothetical protein X975_01240, partial [Stegodyphus mimosarum]